MRSIVPEAEPSGIIELGEVEDTFTDKSSDWRIPENKLPCAYGSSGLLSCLKRFLVYICSQKLSLTVSFNRNVPMIRAHPSVRKGSCYEVHDIEDLVKVGEMVQGCSDFGAQAKAEVADIVFCPTTKFCQSWTAEKALRELEEASISKQCFPSLQECATQAIRIAADADPDIDHLSGMASTVIEGLFSSLTYFFSGNGKHICDYQLALQCQTTKSEAGFAAEESPCTFSLWCLNPSLVFKNMADTALSVILTSAHFKFCGL
ncbi:fanconi anemia group J protein [Tanacetum coccineum]